uniref:Uncharacterized protein n=1 Tax=Helicotheca tamesis TaxID=374047 RepID=A0A7S2MEK2_9STRA|mmetsp:Transcript_14804/g.20189  ORF Transcript_14804/g.20189 Transcript_14804/m.20189 type:complete len:292 (+) Transcript_14804:151-1026(+)
MIWSTLLSIKEPFEEKNEKNEENHKTFIWWTLLVSIAALNISLWLWTYSILSCHNGDKANIVDPDPYQRYHLILSGVYVFVCAYRSVLPRIDLERYCLFDTWWSSIFLGRSAATIAEISFSAQVSLFLYRLGYIHGHPFAQNLSLVLVPLITIAQIFCWCGVVTSNHLYHAIEESIWAISSAFIGFTLATFSFYHADNSSIFLLGVCGSIASALFFTFMVTVDVPMYLDRFNHGRKIGRVHTSPYHGSYDAWNRRVVTSSWKVWKQETYWLTGYFSSAVWLSLLFVHMPVQ